METTCSGCGHTGRFVTDVAAGDVVCTECGLVAESGILDDRPIFNAHTPATTTLDHGPFSALNAHFNATFDEQRRQQLVEARNYLKEHLYRRPCPGITDPIIDYAIVLYSNYLDRLQRDRQVVRGDHHRSRILVGCLMHSVSHHHADVEQRNLATVFDLDITEVSLGTNIVSRSLGPAGLLHRVHVPSVTSLVFTYAAQLSFSRPMRREAMATARSLEDRSNPQRDFKQWRPNSLAAGVVWHVIDGATATMVANGLKRRYPSQDNVSAIAGVSKTTFLAVHKRLKQRHG